MQGLLLILGIVVYIFIQERRDLKVYKNNKKHIKAIENRTNVI